MHNEILDIFAEHPGEYVSGESISRQLSLTRAAIWKQIQSLRKAGYEIDAQTKKGYRLVKKPLGLDEWAFQQELRTKILGRQARIYDELPSTNDQAKEEIRSGVPNGLVIMAKRQTEGRGRLQRKWESPAGGLWMSVVLQPNLSLADASKLTLGTGIAVVDALWDLYGLRVGIKWPNDLVYEGKKLAGILGEVVGEWSEIQTMVLGIGLNVNIPREQLSGGISATTIQEILGYTVNLNVLAARLLERLEQEVHSLEAKEFASLKQRWQERALGLGQEVMVIRAGQEFRGIFSGITDNGELILHKEGTELAFSAGEVQLRSHAGEYF